MNLGRYSKFIAAALGAIVVGLDTFTTISPADIQGTISFVASILAAAGVFQLRNTS